MRDKVERGVPCHDLSTSNLSFGFFDFSTAVDTVDLWRELGLSSLSCLTPTR